MGLFDVFKKKDCEICGKEVGLLGYKKLEDGEICKDCVKLLSPWFDDRRHSTVEQIKRQIAAREENRRELQAWSHNLCFGEWQKIYIRMENGLPESFVVSSDSNYKDANADIIHFADVSSCDVDIRESHMELKQTNDAGEKVSYNPPRFEYSYDFYIKLGITGIEYIDDIRVKVNRSTLHLETTQHQAASNIFLGQSFDPMHYPEYREYKAVCDTIAEIISCGQRGMVWTDSRSANTAPVSAASVAATTASTDGQDPALVLLAKFKTAKMEELDPLLKEFCELTWDRPDYKEIQEKAAKACSDRALELHAMRTGNQSAAAWKCDACGSENTGKFCQSCGAAKPEPAPAAAQGWKCFCGTVNTGGFCTQCGTKKFSLKDIWCSECSWAAEPGDVVVPTFCPNCGKRFNADDI